MIRIKSSLKQLLKEYLLDTGKFQKSDRIYVTSVTVTGYSNPWYYIRVRKAFVKNGRTQIINLDIQTFKNWVKLKLRTEKILNLKSKII